MYSKFSIVEFTTLSFVQTPQYCMDGGSTCKNANTHIELMPKKRGRPKKNEPKSNTQMVITSTESMFQFSKEQDVPVKQTIKKRKNRDGTCWQRSVKSTPVTTSLSSKHNACSSSAHCTINSTQQDKCMQAMHGELPTIPQETTKKRIVRSSISIRELLN